MRFLADAMDPAVFKERRERFAALLEEKKLDGFFFSGATDLYYLTGFHSDGFYGLATIRGVWLFASALLAGQVREHAPGCRLVVGKRLSVSIEALAKARGFKRLGFDPDQVLYRLGEALRKKGLQPMPNPLEALRIIKDAGELDRLRRACRISALSLEHVRRRLRPGMTEVQMARAVAAQFERRGASGVAFDLIAAVGPNTALPHHIPGQARLAPRSAVLFDIGCRVGAYRSDLTRSFHYGKMEPVYRRVFEIVRRAQEAGIQAVRPGSTGGRVDAAARGVIRRAGHLRDFLHSTGHGVGIDIHEPPWVRPKSPDELKPDMILTVEPGIYLAGRFGVRIEDTVRVAPDGREILTRVPSLGPISPQ